MLKSLKLLLPNKVDMLFAFLISGLSLGIVRKSIEDLDNTMNLLVPAAVSPSVARFSRWQVETSLERKIRIIISHNVKYAKMEDVLTTLRFVTAARLGFPVMVYVKGMKVSVDEDKEMGAA